uniref:Elastin microfibril interfacer 3a n=1 Tax=Gadus morhua TaxID=8049 RepID=A0A8C5FFU4_GADMO
SLRKIPPHPGLNHCAYVVEKTVSFTMQEGAAPYVKAEYNNCSWGKKCPALLYRLMYKPIFKVAHKTVTELEWRCCPGFSGYGCMESAYHHPVRMMPPFNGPSYKGQTFKGPQFKGPPHKGPSTRRLNGEAGERLDQMEDDLRRLSQGLETLRGTVNGLEDSLRASLREDANRMLSALLSAGPSPVSAPALAVGFGDIPGGDPALDGLDGRLVFPVAGDLNGKMEELRADLRARTAELLELRTTVLSHDGALKTLSGGRSGSVGGLVGDGRKAAETLVDVKLSSARAEILDGLEGRVTGAEGRCKEKAGEVRRQCQREHGEQQERMQQGLEDRAGTLKREMVHLQTQVHGLEAADSCCGGMPGLVDRMQQLETSVAGLNRSQGHLRVELGGHRDHIEGMLEGRLGYVESKLNLTGTATPGQLAGRAGGALGSDVEQRLEAKMAGQLKTDVDRVQKHLSSLEVRCGSSCASSPGSSAIQGDAATTTAVDPRQEEVLKGVLDLQADRLDSLNATLDGLQRQLAAAAAAAAGGSSVQGELTFLKFNIRSVNRTLSVLRGSVEAVEHQVERANSTWHQREERLAGQMRGVVQLVGRQASMLGSGERRLTRLKGELTEMRRRLAGELQGCRSTALGVRKEVTQVEGRVASVEDRCKGLSHVAEDLERIREELESQAEGLFTQLNGTLYSHAQQLTDLRGEVRNCSAKAETTQCQPK